MGQKISGAQRDSLSRAACGGQTGGNCKSFIVPSGVYMAGDHGDAWIDESTVPHVHPITDVWEPNEQAVAEARRHSISAVALRFGSIYSAHPQGTFGRVFLTAIAKGQFRYPGSGKNYFPLTSMSDAVATIIYASENAVSAPFLNVVDDEPIYLKEAVTLLAQEFGQQAKSMPHWLMLLVAGKPLGSTIGGSFKVKNTQAKTMLNWQPQHSFREQVKPLVAEFKQLSNDSI